MRPYGSGGKNWNVGLSQHGLLSATQRQHFQLQKLTGIDHRGKGLTRDQASDLISQALEERSRRKASLTTVAEQLFSALYMKAVDAANLAGDKWLKDNPEPKFSISDSETGSRIGVHGEIGTSWITWPQKGSDFYKWLLENMYDGQKKVIPIPHKHAERLEGELQLACERAAFEVFKRSASSIGNIRLMYRCEDRAQAA